MESSAFKGSKGTHSSSFKDSGLDHVATEAELTEQAALEAEEKKGDLGPRTMEVVFEINAPPAGQEEDEWFETPIGANAARIEELKEELSKPHSMLRLRIKDRLEKAIAMDTVKAYDVPLEAKPLRADKYNTDFTIHQELSLREAPKPTGNAYMMKGYTPQSAPLMGVKEEHRNQQKTDIEISSSLLPAPYQSFRPETEYPLGRDPPSPIKPTGSFKRPPPSNERTFTLVRSALPPPAAKAVPRPSQA